MTVLLTDFGKEAWYMKYTCAIFVATWFSNSNTAQWWTDVWMNYEWNFTYRLFWCCGPHLYCFICGNLCAGLTIFSNSSAISKRLKLHSVTGPLLQVASLNVSIMTQRKKAAIKTGHFSIATWQLTEHNMIGIHTQDLQRYGGLL